MEQSKIKELFSLFDIEGDGSAVTSIYPYAPVYKCEYMHHDVIIKRTRKKIDEANQLKEWLYYLTGRGIKVVTPFRNKPFVHFDGDNWVMYPFIEGRIYNGSAGDIVEAGKLLGQLHSQENLFNSGRFDWAQFDEDYKEEIISDVTKISNWIGDEPAERKFRSIADKIEKFLSAGLACLPHEDLPIVTASRDYKASNIIFTKDEKPTLIDPDNGGMIPRIVDLAIACILFHNDGIDSIPARPLTKGEWDLFMEGYNRHVELTDIEKEVWNDILTLMYMDEGLWLIVDSIDDTNSRLKEFTYSLTQFDFDLYKVE
ncbi:phosphotransferase enzyme family protein [Mechercharimyces sp. CAU 1602]|uniref:phosphotransferase enzyme family protein n=1 Tax=Mechercharimyces sp. CAU 1602 TaxID=2973933 RepID=UPI00216369BF|nr:phosphotransferase [Mechercharimyces sp. CAU 1602]MCS1350381.1 phosphotransferase [Mechercharimyces sp. CAU 1602]